MIHYREIDGCWTVSDTHVLEYYRKMDLKNLFYLTPPTDEQFIRFCKNPHNLVLFLQGGVVIFTDIDKPRAEGHINCWENSMTNAFKALNYVYNLGIETVLGYVPVWNEKTLRFLEKIGFTQIGIIPKYSDTYRGVSDFVIAYRCQYGHER